MNERRLAGALRAALAPAAGGVRYTIVIEATRRTLDGPAMITVGLEAVASNGQSVRGFGCVGADEAIASPYTEAIWRALEDDPAERQASDAVAWLESRAADVLRLDRRLP